MLLIKRLLDLGYVNAKEPAGLVLVNGMQTAPYLITISDKGREFMKELGIQEL